MLTTGIGNNNILFFFLPAPIFCLLGAESYKTFFLPITHAQEK